MKEELKEKINELKSEIDSLRPIDSEREKRIQQKFRLDWNYHSNNIEGNSLTFGETKSFLLHGITADGKPLKDHLDIRGHNEALLILEDVIKDNRPLNENFIRELHQIILHEPYDNPAITPDGKSSKRRINIGSYKKQPNHVKTKTGEIFYFASPEETPAKMNDLMDWYNEAIEQRKLHPVEIASLLHYKFIRIHPFDDGNGRLARILMNLCLMRFGFTPVIIKTQKKDEYYRALQQADGGEEDFFINYIAALSIDSLSMFLKGAKGQDIEEDDDIDKEIALYKAQLENLKLKKELTSNIRVEVFDWVNENIIQQHKLAQLFDLFDKSIIKIQGFGKEFHFISFNKTLPTVQLFGNGKTEFLELLKTNNQTEFVIYFLLEGFDKPGYKKFTIGKYFTLSFEKYRFLMTIDEEVFSIIYDEMESDLSLNKSVLLNNSITKQILDGIKNNTVKLY